MLAFGSVFGVFMESFEGMDWMLGGKLHDGLYIGFSFMEVDHGSGLLMLSFLQKFVYHKSLSLVFLGASS